MLVGRTVGWVAIPLRDDNPARVGKPLERELAGTPSARRGDYRVIYEIRPGSNEVLVIRIDHRAHIYRAR